MGNTARREFREASVKMNRRDPSDCLGESCEFDPRLNAHSHSDAIPHDHAHSHAHAHDHHHDVGRRRLSLVLVITAAFMVVELIGGIISNSLALIADAAHMLTDVGAIGLSLFVLWFSRRPARPQKTYGYLRLEILAALINGVMLVVISCAIFWQAYQRFRAPEPVEGGLMLGVAAAGLAVNIVAAMLLHSSATHSLNLRGAYLHVIGDLIGSVGAIIAAVLILTMGWIQADPVISVLVGVLILYGSWKLVRESVDILLEAVPKHIDLSAVRTAIDQIPDVDDVHDLHVWTVTSGYLAMSGHAVVRNPARNQEVLREIHRSMRENFGITHVTVQLECPGT
jgi:cobalt-zinc-cadmium efflux system protein